MRRLLILALACSACSYDDPAVEGSFRCDDANPCDDGQSCVAGQCTTASSSTFDGVDCGTATCGEGMQCCAGPINAPVCQPIGAACSNGGAARCDGIEDCDSGQACCGTTATSCGASTCGARACQSVADCTGTGSTSCCFDLTYLPWGFCC